MPSWEIRQQPGARARDLSKYRLAGVVEAPRGRDALAVFVRKRYVETGNRQYVGHRFEWRGPRLNAAWHTDDGDDKTSREWSLVVTLQNGREWFSVFSGKTFVNRHDVRFEAWRDV